MAQAERTPNQLIRETSPYLLQHAYNPVEWYPWNDDALTRARTENKLILLSIGYSACHWCHVMEHESFEDQATADMMNDLFVCIKVDREERPDLDKIYQLAHQMMTQRAGGWPLTLFLTPDEHIPLFAGTYFPKEPRFGMPGFMDIMQRVASHYDTHRDDLQQHNEAIRAAFTRIEAAAPSAQGDLSLDALRKARDELEQAYDPVDGGFGSAPKFPHPTNIERLLHYWSDQKAAGANDERALEIALHTLRAMANGGIYDHLGGGFCRYSVDSQWAIPHFEKMLYDNAQLLPLYVDAYVISGEKQFLRVANETCAWIMREMQSPDGGYYSTLDADSEGEEGRFYAWTIDELKNALDENEWRIVETHYGLRGSPNFEGKWHLCARVPLATAAQRLGLKQGEAKDSLNNARHKLFTLREQRVRPGRDEKILTAWNGMMIKAMAHAGRWLQRDDWIESAQRALDFAKNTLWRDGRLLATTRDGKTHLNAYLDDYVWLADGSLELLQARWRDGDIEFAMQLADVVLDHFEDKENGGFFFTSDDHEQLLHRHKPTSDDAIPSGNGIAASMLLRLGHITGEHRYLESAERAVRSLYGHIQSYPSAHGALLSALNETVSPPQSIILRGETNELQSWMAVCLKDYSPHRQVYAIPDDAASLPGLLAERTANENTVAYVCEGFSCQAPATDIAQLENQLNP